ncbi:MAG: chemotaxis protein CheA [Nitrospinae bacterium]|nr:chemotaxis protein CheA [Nitrospinota bacterium]
MTTNGVGELLETLGEISAGVLSLTPELYDKKTVSDVMLALEKIQADVRAHCPPKAARLCEALAILFEKFLMESVADGGPGIDATKSGIAVIVSAIKKDKNAAVLDADSDVIVASLGDSYGINLPPAPNAPEDSPAASPSGEGKEEPGEAQEEGDDFFAGLKKGFEDRGGEAGRREESAEEAKSIDPLLEKLNRLAGSITMMEPDLMDKKEVADNLVQFDHLAAELDARGYSENLAALAKAVSSLFEKSLMDGLDEGEKGLALVSEAIKILSAGVERIEEPDSVAQWAMEAINNINTFLAGPPAPPSGAAPAAQQPAAKAAPSAKKGEVRQEGVDIVRIASDEDLLLYTEFVGETGETLANVESDLLEIESNPGNMELINNLFRAVHSLKGAAGFLGISTINVLCHEAESLMDKIRKKTLDLNQGIIDALLKTVDVIKTVNEGLNASCQKAKASMPGAQIEIPKYSTEGLSALLSDLGEQKDGGAAPTVVVKETVAGEPGVEKLGELLVSHKVISEDQLESALETQKPLGKILVDMGMVDEKTISESLKEQDEKRKKAVVTTLKVDTEKLDSLLELVGELVISQSIVAQDKLLLDEGSRAMQRSVLNLGKITKNIQDHVMGLRMVQIKQTFQKMSRLVRDLSRKMNKQVAFHLSGEETEIDKTIVEELNDPLVHLLRNAMDHGVESPEDRTASGKSAMGNVWLSAFHRGGNVYIEIKDDGKGLDKERIMKKAVEKELVAPGAELSETDIFNLVFMPGFSTAVKVTDVSGRGVGMDVVRSNIDKLGGKVEISSKPGAGSTFTVKLPLTMAIVDGMIVRIGDERFIIPTVSIRESIRPKAEEVSTVRRDGEMINIRGHLLPLIRLHDILKVKDAKCTDPKEALVIIVESDEREYGFMVDDLLGQQQVVIKSLGKRFKGLGGISGGTILGDGRVGLILDVSGVVAMN